MNPILPIKWNKKEILVDKLGMEKLLGLYVRQHENGTKH